MRYLAAVLALVLGGVALFVGIAQQTIWAPSQTATATITQSLDKAPVTLIRPDVQAISKEPVDFTITSDTPFVAALGRTGDVDAWVKGSAYNELTGIEKNGKDNSITAAHHDGAASVPAPASSDLWVAQQESQGQMVHQWTVPDDGPWTLLLASKDGKGDAPVNVQVSWADPQETPWAVPLIVIGSILLLIGLGLLGWAISKARAVKSGATSSKTVLKRTRATVAATSSATAAILAMAVSGAVPANASSTSPSPSESAAQSSGDSKAYPIVMPQQLDTILEKVATAVNDSDKANDDKLLKTRAGGAAQSLREYANSLSRRQYQTEKPAAIQAGPVRSAVVPTDGAFPRKIMVVTQASTNDTPQVLTLQQANARAPYLLMNAVPMIGGAEFPGIAIGDQNVAAISNDADGLVAKPNDAVNALAAQLNVARANRDKFESSTFIDETHSYQDELFKAGKDARFFIKRTADPKITTSFRTPDGGAVVSAYIATTTMVRPRVAGSTVTLDAQTARMAGKSTTKDGLNINSVEPVVLYIPSAEAGGKIRVIGGSVLQYEANIVSRTAPTD